MNNMGIFFAHSDRWPLIILWLVMVGLIIHAERLRTLALKKLGLFRKEGAFEKPVNRPLKRVFFLLGTFFLYLACLGPQWGQKAHTFKAQGLDVCFALDLSRSMLAEDVSPSRLQMAKNQLSIFLPRLGGDRAAIVGFAGSGFVAAPLSIDHGALGTFLSPLHPDFVSNSSTNLAAGVDACLSALDLDGVKDRNQILDLAAKLVVLVTDGEDTVEDFKEALSRCEKLGIPVYAFAMGTTQGGPIPLRDATGRLEGYVKDRGGQPALSKLQDSALKDIAKRTGGKLFYASQGVDAWKDFESSLQNYKRDSRDAGTLLDREDRFQWPLLFAFIFLLLDFLLTETKMIWKLSLFLGLLLSPAARSATLPNIFHNRKGHEAFMAKDYPRALEDFNSALGQEAKDPVTRFNWATTKMFSALDPMAKDAAKQVNKKSVEEAVKELELLTKDAVEDNFFKKALRYQLAQGYEMLNLSSQALENYYAALGSNPDKDFDQKIKNNIARLLTEQESGGGGGGGGDSDKSKGEDPKDGKDPQKPQPNSDANQQQQKPKFSGTDISEDQAKQILESVSGEEGEVLKRRAKDEAKSRSQNKDGEGDPQDPNAKPW